MKDDFSLSQAAVKVARSIRDSIRNDQNKLQAWDEPGIMTAIKEAVAGGNDPPDIVRALMLAANDPQVKTPRGFLFAKQHWRKHSPQSSAKPPSCPVSGHGSYYAHNCGACHADHVAVPDGYTPPRRPNGAPMPDYIRNTLKGIPE